MILTSKMYQLPVASDKLLPVGARVRHAGLGLHPSPPRRQTPRPLKTLDEVVKLFQGHP